MLFEAGVPPLQRIRNHFTFLTERLIECGFERGCMLGLFASEMAHEYRGCGQNSDLVFETWCGALEQVPPRGPGRG